ncbi:TRAP transporter small permease subunit [Rhodococcus wratislaviensis]|uniref:TRAP transporter small permease subunit n=1 Tax=Rhodococcus wratislaviensis TaxID=44752 RepID=UPI003651D787
MTEAETSKIRVSPSRRDPKLVAGIEWAGKTAACVGGVALLMLILQLAVDVLVRNFFNQSVPGTTDFVTYWWMPLVAILPLAFAEIRRGHIDVTLITDALSLKMKWVADLVAIALGLITFSGLAWYTFVSAVMKMELNEAALSARWLVIWPVRFVVAAGLILAVLQLVVELYRHLSGRQAPESAVPVLLTEGV